MYPGKNISRKLPAIIFIFSLVILMFTELLYVITSNAEAFNLAQSSIEVFTFKAWLSNYNSSGKALILDSDGITETSLSSNNIRANTAPLSNNDIAYYLTTNKEVWKTIDGGNTFFQLTNFPVPAEGTATDIFAFAHDPNRVWVIVNNGDQSPQCNSSTDWVRVYRSSDGGQSWQYSRVYDSDSNGNELCLREAYRGNAYGNIVYIGGRGAGINGYWDGVIYVSYDGGATWQRDWSHDTVTGEHASSAFSSFVTPKLGRSAGKVWYVGVEARSLTYPYSSPYLRGILKKQGGSWSYKEITDCTGCFSDNTRVKVTDLAVDTWNPDLVMVLVAGHGLYRSETGGDSWTRILADSSVNNAWRIEADPTLSGHFWLAGKINGVEGLYRTSQCGTGDWTQVYTGNVVGNSGDVPVTALALSSPIDTFSKDSDGDGLKDHWEIFGYDHDNDCQIDVDLPAMGASPLHKDLFVEVDYMMGRTCTDPICPSFALRPSAAALNKVIRAFSESPVSNPDGNTGITLHIDNGPNSLMNPLTGEYWGDLSESNPMTLVDIAPPSESSFTERKSEYFEPVRYPIFRYLITANKVGESSYWLNCSPNLRGYADNSNMINYYGAYAGSSPSDFEQAVVFMHELGHTLGLQHGGYDSINDKPNYLSIMNYIFANHGGLIKNLTLGHIDYSRFSSEALPNLDEENLDEGFGIGGINGYGTRYYTDIDIQYVCFDYNFWFKNIAPTTSILDASSSIDWNNSGSIEPDTIVANINGDIYVPPNPIPSNKYSILTIRNDWQTLEYPISGAFLNSFSKAQNPERDVGEPNGDMPQYIDYAVTIKQNTNIFLPLNITTTHPVTLTNKGLLTTTVNLTVSTGTSWFDVSALPQFVTLVPDQDIAFPITVTTPMENVPGISAQIVITATPQEMPTMADSVTLNAGIGPGALYTALPLRGTVPLTVTFTDISLGEITNRQWDFGDGITSTLPNPTYVYTIPGTYKATLTVGNLSNTDVYTRAPEIVVSPPPIVYAFPFSDDMEDPYANWQGSNAWRPVTPITAIHESGIVWRGMARESVLTLVDQLDLTTASSPMLSFRHQFIADDGMGQVVVTTDNGFTWTPVYTITAPVNMWTEAHINLNAYKGQNIGLAFYLREISMSHPESGWFLDDVAVFDNFLLYLPQIQKPASAPQPLTELLTGYPGPSSSSQESNIAIPTPPASSEPLTGYPGVSP